MHFLIGHSLPLHTSEVIDLLADGRFHTSNPSCHLLQGTDVLFYAPAKGQYVGGVSEGAYDRTSTRPSVY